ncbi:OmpA family protein [Nibribacter ruber]|uniref:OmpA family protein n=1 Tax=Nibribacter ruber TaxID=2698458 RepID=A0A6P1P2E7_9BACT|nr:OmpA family protein [Nibribacter ruber]QHL88542.1 OmpA family protein [Nibribacter ruber]
MKYRILPILLALPALLFFSQGAQAQKKELKKAELYYQNMEYALAIQTYKEALKQQEPSLPIVTRVADSYRRLNNAKEAEFWYSQMLAFPDYSPQDLIHYGDAARMNGNYAKAKQLYMDYAELVPDSTAKAMKLISITENAQNWMARPRSFALSNLSGLNSGNTDFGPAFYKGGIVFTSDRQDFRNNTIVSGWTGKPNTALYYSKRDTADNFLLPEVLPAPLLNDYQNGSAIFSADNQTVYFTRVNQLKRKSKTANPDPFSWISFAAPSDYVNRLELYISKKEGEIWSEPEPFPFNNPGQYSVGHPALSITGDTLYFASDMPGTLGSTDIFYTVKQLNSITTRNSKGEEVVEVHTFWSKPVNAGNVINTPGRELFPTVDALTGRLFFSSDGHQGMGGLDVFSAEGAGDAWSNVQNMKYPLNSSADDFSILFEKKDAGFISSNRESMDGSDDIYTFNYFPQPCKLAGKTFEKVQESPGVFKELPVGNVKVALYKIGDTTAVVTYSDANGNFSFDIFDGTKYNIKATKVNYLTRSAIITPECESIVDMVRLGLVLNRDAINKPILVENIYYDLDKHDIRPDAALELDKLVQTLIDNPNIKIELSSHTDSRQTDAYNNLLSQRRAQAAVNYIVSKGIAADRLVAKGYGETRLLNRCKDGVSCSEEEHQLNRRTEFKILKK